jgi:hypothetical protein
MQRIAGETIQRIFADRENENLVSKNKMYNG